MWHLMQTHQNTLAGRSNFHFSAYAYSMNTIPLKKDTRSAQALKACCERARFNIRVGSQLCVLCFPFPFRFHFVSFSVAYECQHFQPFHEAHKRAFVEIPSIRFDSMDISKNCSFTYKNQGYRTCTLCIVQCAHATVM